jgi:phytoene synthase
VSDARAVRRSYGYCERLARREAANFYPAFLLLPAPQRRAMCALYAFMRVTDDQADDPGPAAERLAAWRGATREAIAGRFSHPLHPAFHDTVQRYQIPVAYLEAVLDGVGMDLHPVRFATFAELYPYCYRVASAVGLACIYIWGFTAAEARDYAEKAGIAFQLTNILRDLAEDAARGRVYLPREDLHRFGYGEEQLRRGEINDSFRALMRFEVGRARDYYDASWPLLALLRPAGRAVFQVMWRTYRGLLEAIERRDYDVFSSRVRLSTWRKLLLVLRAVPVRLWNVDG